MLLSPVRVCNITKWSTFICYFIPTAYSQIDLRNCDKLKINYLWPYVSYKSTKYTRWMCNFVSFLVMDVQLLQTWQESHLTLISRLRSNKNWSPTLLSQRKRGIDSKAWQKRKCWRGLCQIIWLKAWILPLWVFLLHCCLHLYPFIFKWARDSIWLYSCLVVAFCVQVGINPGLTAAFVGHHYAGPGNHFCKYMDGCTSLIAQQCWQSDYKYLKGLMIWQKSGLA